MKKKIYFIISAILQMLASANLIANSNEVLEKTMTAVKEMYSAFPVEFQERVISMMNNSGIYYVMGPAIICIIVNAIILILAFANKIVKKRGLLIFLSVICILLSSSTVAALLAIVNFIILLSIKKEEPVAFKEKKKIPEVKLKQSTKKELISSSIIFLFYFSQFIWSDFISKDNKLLSLLIIICFYAIMFILVFVLFGDKLINDFKKLIKNFNAYMEYDLPKYGLMIISFLIVNLICIVVTKNATSANQEAVESLPKIVMFILAVLWAPIVEETVFRGTIRKFINTKVLFIIMSSFVFGFLHATGEGSILEILFTTLPYATLGGWLAYIYYKTDNLANNIMIHAIWNLFAVIMSFLVGSII